MRPSTKKTTAKMVNNCADNNGTGYNLIMANRGGARTGAPSTPPKLQPVPPSSALARPTSAKPAAKKGRKANSKRMGDAIPAASPSRSHRGKLRKSADPVDAGGDAKMGEAAAASGSSGRYAALADVFDDTSSEGAEKRKDDKDPSDMEESDDTEDDDEDDSDDDSDEVEIVEPAKVSKSDPPAGADDDLLDSEEEEDDDIDLDEYEDPSDRDIAWSPEFIDMHLDYVLRKLKEILGEDVDVGISVSNIKDPDAVRCRRRTAPPSRRRRQGTISSRLETNASRQVQRALDSLATDVFP